MKENHNEWGRKNEREKKRRKRQRERERHICKYESSWRNTEEVTRCQRTKERKKVRYKKGEKMGGVEKILS